MGQRSNAIRLSLSSFFPLRQEGQPTGSQPNALDPPKTGPSRRHRQLITRAINRLHLNPDQSLQTRRLPPIF